tara:strand:+ start:1145 stop:1579 length:435 start_codon:yes stop_codon:yes gene_type:complete
MLSRIFLLMSFAAPAMAGDTAQFTLVPRGGIVPFEATCFNDVATAEILTWKQFTQIEFEKRLEFEHAKWKENCQLDISNLQISLDESQIRFSEELAAKNTELEDLRQIIAKDRKKNIPAIIAGSVGAGIIIGLGSAYAINQIVD